MDALQIRHLEIVHSGSKHKFCIFYMPKVSEMLWNTPKHHFGSKWVEWMHYNFGTPKQYIQAWNTSLASFYMPKVSEMLWNTPKHHFGSNEVEWMLYNFGTPK
jgi:glycopeptide antibiotics resistance protein